MQFIRGYSTLSTGLRILPVALSLGLFSVLGANLAARLGTRVIVCTGLALLGGSFCWIAQDSDTIPYGIIVIQMLMMGSGIGLISTPATESILSVLPPRQTRSRVGGQRRHAGNGRNPRGRHYRERLHQPVYVKNFRRIGQPASPASHRRWQFGRCRLCRRATRSTGASGRDSGPRPERVPRWSSRRLSCRGWRMRPRSDRRARVTRPPSENRPNHRSSRGGVSALRKVRQTEDGGGPCDVCTYYSAGLAISIITYAEVFEGIYDGRARQRYEHVYQKHPRGVAYSLGAICADGSR